MSTPRALILLAHGSPDPDWQTAPERVAATARLLASDGALPRRIEIAYLEHSTPRLDEVVASLVADNVKEAIVVAQLLSGGGRHFKVDLPQLVSALSQRFPGFVAELHHEPLGAIPSVIEAMAAAALQIP